MPISLHIEAASFEELIAIVTGLSGPMTGPKQTRTRVAKVDDVSTPSTGNGAALPAGMEDQKAADDMFGDAPAAQQMKATAATPAPMTQEQFLAAMRGLLGKGKDDAVRAKVAEMGYAKVRDVPVEKMADVYAAAQKV